MRDRAKTLIGLLTALAVGATLTGCGGGGGGSSSGGTTPNTTTTPPTVTPTTTNTTTPPTTTTPSVRQAMANQSIIVKAARGAQAGQARPRLVTFRHGRSVTTATDVIEEVLVFDASGNPDLTQCRVLDTTQDIGTVLDTATLTDGGTFTETFHFAGAPTETDTVTGTLTPASGAASATLTGGSDAVTLNGTSTTYALPLAGVSETTPASLTTLHLTAGTYSGAVTATDGGGNPLGAPQLSLTLDTASGSVYGSLDYTDAASTTQLQTVFGTGLDANGEFFGTSTSGTQAESEEFSIAPAAGASGAITVSGVILDGNGVVTVAYSGTLTLTAP